MAQRSRGKKKLSPFTVLGVLLLVIGISALGWLGYQYFGTNAVSQQAFQEHRSELRSKWDQEAGQPSSPNAPSSPARTPAASAQPTTGKADSGKPDPSTASAGKRIPGEAIALLRIPRFGADFEVPILTGTDTDTLTRGVGWYESSAAPGQVGNFAIAGHRVTHGEPFAKLLELRKGDPVIVETRDKIYTYTIMVEPKDLTVQDHDTWVLDPVPGEPTKQAAKPLLTLTTCQDLFRSADRSIGFAELTSQTNKN
ncbi:class E sortase [Granulicoccus phenolivorans]|uniref:class E sortase n=1 Tax=Granulicoccus phenolivorans TaxID=266854 RepID=UPI000400F46E|nr:class E sortase [Granulicoccus phenolivorans]